MPVYLGIEGGGTSWRVALAKDRPDNIIERDRFETGTPEETFAKVNAWIKDKHYDAVGVATFGPVDPKEGSKTWGYITTTPKPNWANTDVMSAVTDGSVPRAFDTDVNAPALAEYMFHAQPGQRSVAYITVGTGVGVGLVVNGATIHGLLHPEGGHIPTNRLPSDSFKGTCPYHAGCVEGLSNSIAIADRKGKDRRDLAALSDDDPVWDCVAAALGSLCMTLVLIASPEKIVISGGVLKREVLFQKIRAQALKQLNGYMSHPLLTPERIHEYITPSQWGDDAGIVGALTLAKVALDKQGGGCSAMRAIKHAFKCKYAVGGVALACLAAAAAGAAFALRRK